MFIKKPKLKRAPKRPKTMTPVTISRYADRLKQVDDENKRKVSEYKKAINKIKTIEKSIARIKNRDYKM